jgi:RHS repeat-associated protein
MCPGIAVLGGGGEGGDGDGAGSGGKDGAGGGGKGNGEGGSGDGKGAGSCGSGSDGGGCPNHHGSNASGSVAAGDPVDVVTGRVFTVPVLDLELPGPLPLQFERRYNSAARDRDVGLGFGVSHSLAWQVVERSRRVVLHTYDGMALDFGTIAPGEARLGPHGWLLHRDGAGFKLDIPNDRSFAFHDTGAVGGSARCRLTQVVDPYGNTINLVYREGVLVEIVDSTGRVVRVLSTREGRIEGLALKDTRGQGDWQRIVRYVYDAAGRLVTVEDADGVKTTYSYDDDNLLTSQTRPGGLTFFYRYDRHRRCIETWGAYPGGEDPALATDAPLLLADGETRAKGIHHAVLVFGDNHYSEVITSATLHRYFGNEHGKLDKAFSAGAKFKRKFDDRGFLLEFTDACGAKTLWERDLFGRETKIVDALGGTTLIERETDGHIRRIVDAGGGITVVERAPHELSWRDPIGATFLARYDPRGLIRETVAPNGDVTRYRYDAHANLMEMVDARGAAWRATYDAWGRCTSATDVAGATTQTTYSSGGRVLAIVSPGGETTRYDYDPAGRVAAVRGALGTTTYAYGGLDRLCEVVAPNGERASLRYDREGRLSSVTNARGEVYRFVRRHDGLVIEEHTFDGRRLCFKYDAMGRQIEAENGAGEKVEIERDLLGRMVKRTFGEREESFEHDARGDVIRAVGGDIEVAFERNLLGWIVQETQRAGAEAITVDVEYDLMGRAARRATSRGHSVQWERHGAKATAILDGTERIEVAFDAAGREIGRGLPQGGLIHTAYDAGGQLASRRVLDMTRAPRVGEGEPAWIGDAQGAVTVDQRYLFSSALLAKRWDRALGLTRFDYDPQGRLLSVIPEKARAELFRYGPGGELHEADSSARAYGPGGRLLRADGMEYTWDRAGRIIEARGPEGGPTRYEWSANGQLLAVERADGLRVEHMYDPFDRRILKRAVQVEGRARRTLSTTRFVWDATTLVHDVKTTPSADGAPGVEERTFCFEEHRSAPWAQKDKRGWFHYLNDDSGAPERLIDGKGNVACELHWTAWGRAEVAPGAVTSTPFRFRGQYADEETGLSYNFHRYYDPSTGRYLSADPIGIVGGSDVFAYANNCPTSAVDVEGLMYSAIKDGSGNPVAEGNNLGTGGGVTNWDPAMGNRDYRPSCSESTALNNLAGTIRNENPGMSDEGVRAEMGRRFTEDGYQMETYEGTKERKEGLANPCKCCGAMIQDLGIADGTMAANDPRKKGAKNKPGPWNQTSYWPTGKGSGARL